jgi:hypothetical protein
MTAKKGKKKNSTNQRRLDDHSPVHVSLPGEPPVIQPQSTQQNCDQLAHAFALCQFLFQKVCNQWHQIQATYESDRQSSDLLKELEDLLTNVRTTVRSSARCLTLLHMWVIQTGNQEDVQGFGNDMKVLIQNAINSLDVFEASAQDWKSHIILSLHSQN